MLHLNSQGSGGSVTTRRLVRGVPLKVASARASHSGIAITADIYGHLLPVADEEAAAKADLAYGGGRQRPAADMVGRQ